MGISLSILVIGLSYFANAHTEDEKTHPNIILMVMDDLGFNDVPWHDHSNTQMPFLENFVNEQALKIDTFYAMPLCSMTRSALLTGRYPMRYGLQSSVVENSYPFGLSTFETIITHDFKSHGYDTYMVGKWHLGFHREDLTPLNRGFDEFRGSLSPMIHYFDYSYTVNKDGMDYTGHDLWINNKQISAQDTNNQYVTDWEADQFMDILDDIVSNDPNGKQPFFMYVAMHASHDPREATTECLGLYYETECMNRQFEQFMNCQQHQVMQAQSSCADLAQERMITYLQTVNDGKIWDNTLIIWLSDNGAPPWDGDNSPLRGAKKELWEGGVRTPAFISGGYLNSDRYGKSFNKHTPFHVVDMYPTILSAAGIKYTGTNELDGYSQWDAIQNDIIIDEISGKDREFLYNVDPEFCETVMCGAYRYGPWKFIWSQNTAPDQMYWFDYYSTNPRRHDDGMVNDKYTNYLNCGPIPDGVQTENRYDENGDMIGSLPCGDKPCIFNIEHDPCEYNDLSMNRKYENLYLYMYNMLMAYYESQQVSLRAYYEDKFDTNGDPGLHDGFWQPWVSSYDHDVEDDGTTYFEDILRSNENYEQSQDIKLSKYYGIAMKYKLRWDEQVLNGLLDNDENMIPIDEDMSVFDPLEYHTSNKHFHLLMGITIVGGIIILFGFIIIVIRWWQTCCAMRRSTLNQQKWKKVNEEYERIEDEVIYETVGVEQLILEGNQKRSRYPFTKLLDMKNDSIDVNDVIDSILDEDMPLLMDTK